MHRFARGFATIIGCIVHFAQCWGHDMSGQGIVNPWKKFVAKHYNDRTAEFHVDPWNIPDVSFNVGESYAGRLPSGNGSNMFFWYFPTVNPKGSNDTVIWFNGGPGCSGLGGMYQITLLTSAPDKWPGLLQENGPISWRPGQFEPVVNPWSWHKLANVVWIDYPVGAGFSEGPLTAQNDDDLSQQFLAFWKDFATTFDIYDNRLFLASESYGGVHVPYVGAAMLAQDDARLYNLNGGLMYSPVMPHLKELGLDLATIPAFSRYWKPSLGFGSTGVQNIENMSQECKLQQYLENHLVYPPPDRPWQAVNQDCTIFEEFFQNAINANNCLNVYHITDICPVPSSVIGHPAFPSLPGSILWPNRPEVRRALHVPIDSPEWSICQQNVFATVSGAGAYNTSEHEEHMRTLIETTGNVLIASGTADAAVFPNGTALAIQHLSWNDVQGFQQQPKESFVVPSHKRQGDVSIWAGGGEQGTFHTERGLTYITLLAGHQVPQYAPTAAFRHLEYLLGRVDLVGNAGSYSIDI